MANIYQTRHIASFFFILAVTAVAGFLNHQSCSLVVRLGRQSIVMNSWLRITLDQLGKFLDDVGMDEGRDKLSPSPTILEENEQSKKIGRIIRTAVRAYDTDASKPSSRLYTTRKDAQLSVTVSARGVEGDYNHYRTAALQSTPDRAISILTSDAMKLLRSMYPSGQDGDLGENLYVDGIGYRSLNVGMKVVIGDEVLLEITEPIEPCANLCKLPYINDGSLNPKQRIERCQQFITWLDEVDGLRGWYAKVLQPGIVRVGDILQLV